MKLTEGLKKPVEEKEEIFTTFIDAGLVDSLTKYGDASL